MREADYCYSFADFCLKSTSRLKGLQSAELFSPSVDFVRLNVASAERLTADMSLSHIWQQRDGSDTSPYELYANRENYMLVLTEGASFVVDRKLAEITAIVDDAVSEETLNHLLLDQVLPRLLAHMGRTVLHAGGVAVGGEAVCFIGETGAGKSTLTASFHLAGYKLLSDDAIIADVSADGPATVMATYPSIRLWAGAVSSLYRQPPEMEPMAHYSDKHRLILQPAAEDGGRCRQLKSIFVLEPPEHAASSKIVVRSLAPTEAFVAIARNCFQLDPTDRTRNLSQFSAVIALVNRARTFSISYPRNYTSLADVRSVILSTAGLNRSPDARLNQMEYN